MLTTFFETVKFAMPIFRIYGGTIGFTIGMSNPINGTDNNSTITGLIAGGICTKYPALTLIPIIFFPTKQDK